MDDGLVIASQTASDYLRDHPHPHPQPKSHA
jgi:hypothetical protein